MKINMQSKNLLFPLTINLLLVIIFCFISCQSFGIQNYACIQNGKTVYQPFPCDNTLQLSPTMQKHTKEQDLIIFSKQGNEALVYKLLMQGVSPNATDEQNNTSLFYALEHEYYSIARLLIASKADVNHVLSCGDNLITFFAKQGNNQALQLLLTHAANLNYAEPSHGNTALLIATMHNNIKAVKLLLDAGIEPNSNPTANIKTDINLANNDGITPLIAALENKNYDIVTLLTKNKVNINQLSHSKTKSLSLTPLIHFATIGNQEGVKKLLDLRADVNLANEKMITPLIAAALIGHKKIVELLLDAGADPKPLTQQAQLWEYVRTKNDAKLVKLIQHALE